jgi:hypothetical protein
LNTSFSFIVIETHILVVVKILIKSQTMPREEQRSLPGGLGLNRSAAFANDRTSAKRQ